MELKLFISQPMKDKTNEEIKEERERIINRIKELHPQDDVIAIDSFFENAPHDARPLWFLGKSLELLSTADLCVFAKGYENYRGCRIEKLACEEYEIEWVEM